MTVDTAARAAIADLNARFAWALDLHDWAALPDLLTADVHYMSGGREFHDADSVIASFRRACPATRTAGAGRPDVHISGRSVLKDRAGPGTARYLRFPGLRTGSPAARPHLCGLANWAQGPRRLDALPGSRRAPG